MCEEKLFIGERPTIELTPDGDHVTLTAPGVRVLVLPVAVFRYGVTLSLKVLAEHDARQLLGAQRVVPLRPKRERKSV